MGISLLPWGTPRVTTFSEPAPSRRYLTLPDSKRRRVKGMGVGSVGQVLEKSELTTTAADLDLSVVLCSGSR